MLNDDEYFLESIQVVGFETISGTRFDVDWPIYKFDAEGNLIGVEDEDRN